MNLYEFTINKLKERGVSIDDIAIIVFDLQKKYIDSISLDECTIALKRVLNKREVIHAVLTGIAIDEAVENKNFPNPLWEIINNDYSLYGIDEILALGIVNIYGSIAFTNFGYLDKEKPQIIGKLDSLGKNDNCCHTFLDDIVCALAASAASKIAHNFSEN